MDKIHDYSIVVKSKSGCFKIIPPDKYFINRNTPVGEPADYYERMPHGGKKFIEPIGKVMNDIIKYFRTE